MELKDTTVGSNHAQIGGGIMNAIDRFHAQAPRILGGLRKEG